MLLKIHQIYFEDSQLPVLDYTPYKNEECSEFFENMVIYNLINDKEHKDCDYFGVVSYQLRDKIMITKNGWKGKGIANISRAEFTPQDFERQLHIFNPDAMSFQRHMPHDPIMFANQFHPNFSNYFKIIMQSIGYDWKPTVFQDVFYCNFFVAKPDVYYDYCQKMLFPAMMIMQEMEELWNDSRYPKELPDNLKRAWGINHYTYHTFLCERMFSYYAHLNKIRCLHY